jgi:hypothetical protein
MDLLHLNPPRSVRAFTKTTLLLPTAPPPVPHRVAALNCPGLDVIITPDAHMPLHVGVAAPSTGHDMDMHGPQESVDIWLFETFLRAMGRKAPTLIVTDEDASMRAAIAIVLPNTIHRLCMWHIMKKLPEKIDAYLLKDDEFRKMINSCVWDSKTTKEFETRWQAWITTYHLESNEWLVGQYHIRESWIQLILEAFLLAAFFEQR